MQRYNILMAGARGVYTPVDADALDDGAAAELARRILQVHQRIGHELLHCPCTGSLLGRCMSLRAWRRSVRCVHIQTLTPLVQWLESQPAMQDVKSFTAQQPPDV